MFRRLQKSLPAFLFSLPALLFLGVFVAYPLVSSFCLSLTDYNLIWSNTTRFVGPGNYWRALHDPVFRAALANTLVYVAFHVPVIVVLSLILATLIQEAGRFGRVCQSLLFIPVLIPEAMGAVIFIWLLSERFGLVNHLISAVMGRPLGLNWLGEPGWAMAGIVLTSYWGCGFSVVLFVSGLNNIPRSLYEAAAVDGAGSVSQFFHITVPSLRHTTTVVTILALVNALKVFALPKIMTGGGPGTSTLSLYFWIFKTGFEYFDMGYACAMAYLLALIILIVSGTRLMLSRGD